MIRRETRDERRKSVILSTSEGSRNGFTLMELMVYMAILGIIVIVAGRAFSDSTKFRVRTQNILKATQVAENVATLFKSDVAQMGAKSSKEATVAGGNDTFSEIYADVYWNAGAGDYSSYFLAQTNGQDDLSFRRVRYGADGRYVAVEEVSWFVDANKVLKRSCRTIKGTADADACPGGDADAARANAVEIATDVDLFRVYPAQPGIVTGEDSQMFPPGGGNQFRLVSRVGDAKYAAVNTDGGGESVTVTGFASNYNSSTGEINEDEDKVWNEVYVVANTPGGGSWNSLCGSEGNNFQFVPEVEYEISFAITVQFSPAEQDPAQMFVPGKDHMAVGIRNADGANIGQRINSVPDFLFYPPSAAEANSAKRSVRFTVPETIEHACLAFTFSMFTPLTAAGKIEISELTLKKVPSSNYTFDESVANVAVADRKNVRAFRMKLRIDRSGETANVDIVIPTPSNGVAD